MSALHTSERRKSPRLEERARSARARESDPRGVVENRLTVQVESNYGVLRGTIVSPVRSIDTDEKYQRIFAMGSVIVPIAMRDEVQTNVNRHMRELRSRPTFAVEPHTIDIEVAPDVVMTIFVRSVVITGEAVWWNKFDECDDMFRTLIADQFKYEASTFPALDNQTNCRVQMRWLDLRKV